LNQSGFLFALRMQLLIWLNKLEAGKASSKQQEIRQYGKQTRA
jgi:hypothetical protein